MADRVLEIEARVRDLAGSVLRRIGMDGSEAGKKIAASMRESAQAEAAYIETLNRRADLAKALGKEQEQAVRNAHELADAEAKFGKAAASVLRDVQAQEANKVALEESAAATDKAARATGRLSTEQKQAAESARRMKAGLASMGVAMAAGGVATDSVAGQFIRITSAGLAGYAMLGKVGAGAAVAAAGLALLASHADAGLKDAEAMAGKFAQALNAAREGADASAASLDRMKIEVRALKAELDGLSFDKEGALGALAIDEQARKIDGLREAARKAEQDARDAFNKSKEGPGFVEKWFDPSGSAGGKQQDALTRGASDAARLAIQKQEDLAREEERLRTMKEGERLRQEKARREAANPEKSGGGATKAAEDPEEAAAREREEALNRADEAWKEFDAAVQKTTPEYEKQAELLGRHLGTYERLKEIAPELAEDFRAQAEAQVAREKAAKAEEKAREESKREEEKAAREAERKAEEAERHAEKIRDANQRLEDQVALLRATDEWERKRLEIHQELRDLLANEETKANAQTLLAERLAALAAERAESEQKAAEASAKSAEEQAKSARAKREADRPKDITKKFAGFGNGLFGFGAGTPGFGNFDGDEMTAIANAKNKAKGKGKQKPAPAGGAAGAGAGPDAIPNLDKLPDPKPEMAKVVAELRKIPPAFDKIVTAAKEQGAAATKAIEAVGKATTKAVADIKGQVNELKDKVRSLEAQIREAARGGGSGG